MGIKSSNGKFKVAVAQMNSTSDVQRNLEQAEGLVRDASLQGAKLVLLPECFAYLGPEKGKISLAESLNEPGPILQRAQSWATSGKIEIILGGFWEKSPDSGKVYNTSVHLGVGGQVKAAYRKMHLFDVDLDDGTKVQESETQLPGDVCVVTETEVGVLGLSICYDLRFPELYRQLVNQGATILAAPAAFTLHTGKDHWHVLTRARAVESQCYLLAAGQWGNHFGNRSSYGHSLICDPWGCVLAECGEGVGIATAYVDQEYLTQVRRTLPSLKHRRL